MEKKKYYKRMLKAYNYRDTVVFIIYKEMRHN